MSVAVDPTATRPNRHPRGDGGMVLRNYVTVNLDLGKRCKSANTKGAQRHLL